MSKRTKRIVLEPAVPGSFERCVYDDAIASVQGTGSWTVYILRCADGTLYTGISTDPFARLGAHNAGRGAKYTRGRGPCQLIAYRFAGDRSTALQLEAFVKKQRKDKKLHALLHWCFFHGPFEGERCTESHGDD